MPPPSPTWILLRGLGHDRSHWMDFYPQLERAFPTRSFLHLDLPGVGERHRESSPCSAFRIAQKVREQALEKSSGPYSLLTCSLGSMVAAQWAQNWPEDLTQMTLINVSFANLNLPHKRFHWRTWGRYFQAMRSGDSLEKERLILSILSSQECFSDASLLQRIHAPQRAPIHPKNLLRQLLAAATCSISRTAPAVPTLLLSSSGDQLCDPYCSQTLSRIWKVPLVTHPWAGHDLTLDAPQWVIEQLLKMEKS